MLLVNVRRELRDPSIHMQYDLSVISLSASKKGGGEEETVLTG